MLEAITYGAMLDDIQRNQIKQDTIGILITRPDLDGGKSIIRSLNYYHHLSGENTNFYLPGFGAYWCDTYPDERIVVKIDGVNWFYSDKMFVDFVRDLEKHCTWRYSGETELLMLQYQNGILSYDNMLRFYLDNMLRDNVIVSVSAFFQQLCRVSVTQRTIHGISNQFGKQTGMQITKETILNNLPAGLSDTITKEKYFCVKNYGI